MAVTSRRKFELSLVAIIALSIALYATNRMWNFARGPVLTIIQPQNGTTVPDALVTIEGNGKNVVSLYLNGRKILLDDDNAFSESLLLAYGYNILELEARDRFNRTIKKELILILK